MTELNRFWVFMTFTASLAALVACGAKKNESPFAVTDSVFVKEGLDQKALADANVRCDGPNDCPEGIALMAVQVTKGRFDLCTAFLVSEDIVATNSHCLQQAQEGSIPGPVEPRRHNIGGKKTPAKPVEVKPTFATPSQCPNIHFFFPKTGSQLQQMVQCHSVVGASKVPLNAKGRDFLNLPDYAFIRLTRSVGRTALPLSRLGLTDGLELTTWSMSPESTSLISAVLKSQTCVAVQGTTIVPSFTKPTSPIVTIAGCTAEKGNSGAPFIDNQGNVRAIGFGVFMSTETTVDGLAAPIGGFKPLIVASNVACMQSPKNVPVEALTRVRGEDCGTEGTQKTLIDSLATGDAASETPSFTRPEMFNFKSISTPLSGTEGHVTPIKQCIDQPSLWVDGITDPKLVGLEEFSKVATKVTLSILAPLWKSTYALDENFKVVRNDEGAGEVLTKMEFDTEKLEEMKIEHFVTSTSLGKDGASADSIYSTPAIPVCK